MYYDNVRTGDLMTRATNDLDIIRGMVSNAILYTVEAIVLLGCAITIMLRIDASLTGVALLSYLMLVVFMHVIRKRVHACYKGIQDASSDMNTKVQENLSGVRVVKAYTLEASETRHFEALNQELVNQNYSLIRLMAVLWPLCRGFLPGIGSVVPALDGRSPCD